MKWEIDFAVNKLVDLNMIKEQKFDIKAQIFRNTRIFKENFKLITNSASKLRSWVDLERPTPKCWLIEGELAKQALLEHQQNRRGERRIFWERWLDRWWWWKSGVSEANKKAHETSYSGRKRWVEAKSFQQLCNRRSRSPIDKRKKVFEQDWWLENQESSSKREQAVEKKEKETSIGQSQYVIQREEKRRQRVHQPVL